MGHGNPDNYDSFKANVRYTQLEEALQKFSKNYYVGTVDMKNNYKQDVMDRMKGNNIKNGKVYLHALMSIAGDHAHNDMALIYKRQNRHTGFFFNPVSLSN